MTTALALVLALTGCNALGSDPGGPGGTAGDAPGSDRVAMVLEGESITIAEVDAFLQQQFLEELRRRPEAQVYEAREQAMQGMLEKYVVEREAEARGVSPETLREEIADAVEPPNDAEVAAWYAENQARLRGAPLEAIGPQIRDFLLNERKGSAWRGFVDEKLEALSYELKLEPPRQDIAATRLIRGPEDAPVTVTTFSDYQCPYCIRSEPTLAELRQRYPESVRIVHRHFPLDRIHPFARQAAEAAMCADEQGKFWEYHDAIFARQGQLEEGSFVEIAKQVGLELDPFRSCVDDRRYASFVEQDVSAGKEAGVTGTPAFFINGIALKGARGVDELSRVVDLELARLEEQGGSGAQ